MRLSRPSARGLRAAALLLACAQSATAKPYPRSIPESDDPSQLQNTTELELAKRCNNPCGWAGQLCCAAGQSCYTDSNNQAQCGGGVTSAGGYWAYYTTTWVDTKLVTYTSVLSTWVASQVTAAGASPTASCNYANNESPCGSICCASNQYCAYAGQCVAAAGGSSGVYNSIYATASPTTTVPFQTPVATGASVNVTSASQNDGSGLSGGAIAGIVVGTLAGVVLLVLLCIFCCFRAGWHGFLALFGGGKRRAHEEYVQESIHHSASGGGGGGRRWYGDRPGRAERKKGGLGGLLGAGAALATLGAALGLKRKWDHRHDEKSDYSSSYGYYSSDYTSTSSASSDERRTRPSRHSSRL